MNQFSLHLNAQCDCVLILRSMVNVLCKRAKLSQIEKNRVGLAVDEVYANIVRHGYQRQAKPMDFHADMKKDDNGDDLLIFTFRDYAPVVNLSDWDCGEVKPCCAETIVPHGLGIPLIHTIMDQVKHEAFDDGNGWTVIYRSKKKIGEGK